MKTRYKIFMIASIVVATLGVSVFAVSGENGTNDTSKKHKDIYYCPMHPTYTSDKPGTCPICNMTLVKKEDNPENTMAMPPEMSPDGYAPIKLTAQKEQLIGVKTEILQEIPLIKDIRTVGTIAHDPELYQVQSEYLQAIQAYDRAKESSIPEITEQSRALVEATRIRLKHMGLSDDLIADMAGWKEPQHGLLYSHPGDPVWVYAKVFEYELPLIKVGQEVEVDVPSLPGELFKGKIRAIDATVDPMTRTTRVRALLDDPSGHLKPDMYVNVGISVDLGKSLAVPQDAVFKTGTKQIVFVDKGEGILEPRDVVLGVQAGNQYKVISGLSAGEKVVTSANFLIDSESRLKAAFEGMTHEGGHQHGQ